MSKYSRVKEDCLYYGRPIEPLAFYLSSFSDVNHQLQCPLYGVLPTEVRHLVFEYALVDGGAPLPNNDNIFRRQPANSAHIASMDVACTLLQTCKAIYLEAYRLPMLINGMAFFSSDLYSRVSLGVNVCRTRFTELTMACTIRLLIVPLIVQKPQSFASGSGTTCTCKQLDCINARFARLSSYSGNML